MPMMPRPGSIQVQTGPRSRQALVGIQETQMLRVHGTPMETRPLQKTTKPEIIRRSQRRLSAILPQEITCYTEIMNEIFGISQHDRYHQDNSKRLNFCQNTRNINPRFSLSSETQASMPIPFGYQRREKITTFLVPNKRQENQEPQELAVKVTSKKKQKSNSSIPRKHQITS